MSASWDPGLLSETQRGLALVMTALAIPVVFGAVGLHAQWVRWRALEEGIASLEASVGPRFIEADLHAQKDDQDGDDEPETTSALTAHEMLDVFDQAAREHGVSLARFRPADAARGGQPASGSVTFEARGRFSGLMGVLHDLTRRPEVLIATMLEVALPMASDSSGGLEHRPASESPNDRDLMVRGVMVGRRTPLPTAQMPMGVSRDPSGTFADPLHDRHPFHASTADSSRKDTRQLGAGLERGRASPASELAARGLADLQMVGSMSWDGQRRGIVRAGQAVHAVSVGDTVGVERLRVIRVEEQAIVLNAGRSLRVQPQPQPQRQPQPQPSTAPGQEAS